MMRQTIFNLGMPFTILIMVILLSLSIRIKAQDNAQQFSTECNNNCLEIDTFSTKSVGPNLYGSNLCVKRDHGNWISLRTNNDKAFWLHNHNNDGRLLFAFKGQNISPVWNLLVLNGNNGNVGIGISYPSEKLSVNGTIKAKEIKVTLDGWADFVFDDNYTLRTLADLEKYIKTNKHLPDIPSAEKVEKKDLELGEMNKRLLQKVEELTLYIIQQEKRIQKLEEQLK